MANAEFRQEKRKPTDYQALRGNLENVSIYLVPEGKIESFCREVGFHGPKFVSKLLRDIPYGNELRKFVEKVYRRPSARARRGEC